MKLEPKIELAKQYDEYVNNKNQIPKSEPEQDPEPEKKVYIKYNLAAWHGALMPREYKIGFPRVASITKALYDSFCSYLYNSLNCSSFTNTKNKGLN